MVMWCVWKFDPNGLASRRTAAKEMSIIMGNSCMAIFKDQSPRVFFFRVQ